LIAAILALAAGGILAMLADTMMPEAFENGGPFVAMATAVGFLCAALLSHLTGS
jgi:zinc transporter, ZIP family